MWQGMEEAGIEQKALSRDDAADLVAFFSSSRFFDRPADAGRGRRAFVSHRCAECHGIEQSRAAGAPPVSEWRSLADPVELAEAMWNHAAKMQKEFTARGIPWPVLTGQDLSDILLYLRRLPSTKPFTIRLQTGPTAEGKALFEQKGCIRCHTGKLDLRTRLHGKTLTDIAASMWNHAPRMADAKVEFTPGEMQSVVSYLWTEALNENDGNARRGAGVFRAKHCSKCHAAEGAGIRPLAKIGTHHYTASGMISAVWSHGPAMLREMKAKQIAWPRLDGTDMEDLISFLNSESLRRRAGVR
jgi:cytochrome c2